MKGGQQAYLPVWVALMLGREVHEAHAEAGAVRRGRAGDVSELEPTISRRERDDATDAKPS